MWPAQDLDALGIGEVERRGRDAAVIDLVDIDADTLFDAVVGEAEGGAQPTDIGGGIARIGGIELQRRLKLGQAADIIGAGFRQRGAADDRYGDGHGLHGFVAAARGDDDVAAALLCRAEASLLGGARGVLRSCRLVRRGLLAGGDLAGEQQRERERHERFPF